MAKPFGGKRPQDLRHTLRRFMDYLGRHKIMLGVVGLLAAVSALAALLGTVPAAAIGGIGTLVVVGLWMRLFPSLRKRQRLEETPA